jgi:hypothetical protein
VYGAIHSRISDTLIGAIPSGAMLLNEGRHPNAMSSNPPTAK